MYSLLLDKDDLRQERDIARWQGKNIRYHLVDIIRRANKYRSDSATKPPRFVALTWEPGLLDADQLYERILDGMILESALNKLGTQDRQLIKDTVIGNQSMLQWAANHSLDDSVVNKRRKRVLERLALMPEIQSLRGN